ncbi:MAG TPA: hypothetical protein DD490_05060, partial [Acidobacteria bacterium]|nr:hypothetical protein [Acidobacteriota bacterium]
KGHGGQIRKAVQLLLQAKRPYIYTGGGVILGNASAELRELVNLLGYPCTNTLMGLGAMPAADSSGATGVRDRTNRHLGRTFGSALLLSVFTAAAQLSQPNSFSGALRAPTAQEIAAGALGQQVNTTADALIERELRIPPTLVVRPGTACQVVVTADLVFPGPFRP